MVCGSGLSEVTAVSQEPRPAWKRLDGVSGHRHSPRQPPRTPPLPLIIATHLTTAIVLPMPTHSRSLHSIPHFCHYLMLSIPPPPPKLSLRKSRRCKLNVRPSLLSSTAMVSLSLRSLLHCSPPLPSFSLFISPTHRLLCPCILCVDRISSSLAYEEVLLRDPYSVKGWLHYLLYHSSSPPSPSPPHL